VAGRSNLLFFGYKISDKSFHSGFIDFVKPIFFRAGSAFDLYLTCNGVARILENFIIDQFFHIVFRGKSLHEVFFVLGNAICEIGCESGAEDGIPKIGHDIKLFTHEPVARILIYSRKYLIEPIGLLRRPA
jgi:hypothetical protein